jgi:hypothetical protein
MTSRRPKWLNRICRRRFEDRIASYPIWLIAVRGLRPTSQRTGRPTEFPVMAHPCRYLRCNKQLNLRQLQRFPVIVVHSPNV